MKRREFKRYTKRLETEFSSGEVTNRGISSDLSERGLFIRTSRSFAQGTPIDMTIHLPEGKTARLKGIVRRAIKTNSPLVKNGMGVEVTEYDDNYREFLQKVLGVDFMSDTHNPATPEYQIIACPNCGVKNKIPSDKLSLGPRCGRCKEPLPVG